MWLTCRVDLNGGATIVRARGEIDAFTSVGLGQCLRQAMLDGHGRITLDLSDVTFIDGAGLRVLERCQRACRERGLFFGLRHPAPHIRRLLQLVDLDRELPVFDSPSEEHADAAVRGASDPA
jgi:anti-anti-sigma factor